MVAIFEDAGTVAGVADWVVRSFAMAYILRRVSEGQDEPVVMSVTARLSQRWSPADAAGFSADRNSVPSRKAPC